MGKESATKKELEAVWPQQAQDQHAEVGDSRQEALRACYRRAGRDNRLRVGLQVGQELLP